MLKLPLVLDIDVTQEDIDNGVRSDCASCPVARAINLRLAEYGVRAHVGPFMISLWNIDKGGRLTGSRVVQVSTPSRAYRALAMFDLGETITPFTFRLALRK